MAHFTTATLCRSLARSINRIRRSAITLLATAGGARHASRCPQRARIAATAARQSGCVGANARVSAAPRAELKAAVVCLINRQRRLHGLPALHESARLDRSAQGWTNVMVHFHSFTHGADFASRISAVGFRWSSAGENIAAGFRTPAAVVRAWMASPGHCRNILSPSFLDVGTGRQPARRRRARAGHLDPGLRPAEGSPQPVRQHRPGQRLSVLIGDRPRPRLIASATGGPGDPPRPDRDRDRRGRPAPCPSRGVTVTW